MVIGPEGSGKTSVARRIAGRSLLYLDTRETQNALVEYVRDLKWSGALIDATALVLDGPIWLHNRPAAVKAFCELIRARQAAGRRTVVCQSDCDCSINELIGGMEPGSLVVVGLRFPKGSRGKLRFARRMCDHLGLPRTAARGSDALQPWRYSRVLRAIAEWQRQMKAAK